MRLVMGNIYSIYIYIACINLVDEMDSLDYLEYRCKRLYRWLWTWFSPPSPPNSMPGVDVLGKSPDVYRANIQQVSVYQNTARGRTLLFGPVAIPLQNAGADHIVVTTFTPSSTTSWRRPLLTCHNYKGLLIMDAHLVRKCGFADDLSTPKQLTYTRHWPPKHPQHSPTTPTTPILDTSLLERVRFIKNKDRTRICTIVNAWKEKEGEREPTTIQLGRGKSGCDIIVVYEFKDRRDSCCWRPDAVELYAHREANMLIDYLAANGFKKKATLKPTTALVLTSPRVKSNK